MPSTLQIVRTAADRARAVMRTGPGGVRGVVVAITALTVALAAWAFIEISEDVAEGDTRRFDGWLLGLLREPGHTQPSARPIGPDWLTAAAIDITSLGSASVLVLVVLLTAVFLAIKRSYRAMLLVVLCTTLGQVINSGLKAWFDRERPATHLHLVEVTTESFPSGHAMMSAVTYLTLGALLSSIEPMWRVKVFVFATAGLLTVLVGLTRVYLGVHHPTDVLAGWAAGLTWALACWLVAQWLQRRGKLVPRRSLSW